MPLNCLAFELLTCFKIKFMDHGRLNRILKYYESK